MTTAAHDHSAQAEGLQDELAQVRRATAKFHRVKRAVEAGYELGWVNGAGVRIVAGCVAHPTANARLGLGREPLGDVRGLEPGRQLQRAQAPVHVPDRSRDEPDGSTIALQG